MTRRVKSMSANAIATRMPPWAAWWRSGYVDLFKTQRDVIEGMVRAYNWACGRGWGRWLWWCFMGCSRSFRFERCWHELA